MDYIWELLVVYFPLFILLLVLLALFAFLYSSDIYCDCQGLLRLREPAVQLRCRKQDLDAVQSVVDSAKETYAQKVGVDVPEVFVDDKHFLPGPPGSTNHGSSWYYVLACLH